MVTALNVANNFIERAFQCDVTLTPMKLQKLIYFTYARYYKESGGLRLFAESFGTWKYGPVLETVYQEFREFGKSPIDRYYERDGYVTSVNEETSNLFKDTIDYVWCNYREKTGIELSNLTHEKDTAWYKAFMGKQPYLNDEDMVYDVENII